MKEEKITKLITFIFISFAMTALLFSIVFICMSYTNGKNDVYTEGDEIINDYQGFYNEINKGDIRSIKLINELPDGGKDGTGVEGRNYIVGNASFDGIGKCKAYLVKSSDEFI